MGTRDMREYLSQLDGRTREAVQLILEGRFGSVKEMRAHFGAGSRFGGEVVRAMVQAGIVHHRNSVIGIFRRVRQQRVDKSLPLDETLALLRAGHFNSMQQVAAHYRQPGCYATQLKEAALRRGIPLTEWEGYFKRTTKRGRPVNDLDGMTVKEQNTKGVTNEHEQQQV